MNSNLVILVDENDMQTGVMEKMEAHRKAMLHRAVSVFIFNSKGEFLLQQRAACKYHSPLLWTNTACTHPMPGETVLEAANRRLMEEMGLQADLSQLFSFIYKEALDNELTEHELDYVFVGISDEKPTCNLTEVNSYCYKTYTEILSEIEQQPEIYTVWFKKIVQRVFESINVTT